MHPNHEETQAELEQKLDVLQSFALLIRDDVSPYFEDANQNAYLVEQSKDALKTITKARLQIKALVVALFTVTMQRNRLAQTTDAELRLMLIDLIGQTAKVGPEKAAFYADVITGKAELPENLSPKKVFEELGWLFEDKQYIEQEQTFELEDYEEQWRTA